ncbi:MAG TPA: Error-prone repair protein ImuA [Hanamia sp.]|nr:Error-prone repair protein ImuA [Hanamia sp.]
MDTTKANIIAQLKKDILPLQGFKSTLNTVALDAIPVAMKNAFPNAAFPLGAVHELIADSTEDATATFGFIAAILASIMQNAGASIWINGSQSVFPPALKSFGLSPDKIIFIYLKKENEILWAMEEALKCKGLSAVIGEVQDLSFTASRRLQLAIEQSQATGFIVRRNPRRLNTSACLARWKITSSPGQLPGDMPGVGFPRWNVELLKVRNGKPGSWPIEFVGGRLRHVPAFTVIHQQQQKKTG